MKVSNVWRWLAVQRLIICQLDVVLSLADKKGNPIPARLYVRVTQNSILVVTGDAKEQAETSAKKLSRALVSDVSGALTNITDALSDQQKLVTSFNSLMKKFEPLIKIADEVAKVRSSIPPSLDDLNLPFLQKIHPYVNFAWQVLSAGLKVS